MSLYLRKTVENVKLRDKWLKSEGLYSGSYADLPSLAELRAQAPDHITQKHEAFKRANSNCNA